MILGRKRSRVAIQKIEQGVQSTEHIAKFPNIGRVDWHDFPIFQEVVRSGSLRRAAAKLGNSVNTVRSKIDRLEASLGAILFNRSNEGIALTADGIRLLELATEMQVATSRIEFGTGNNIVARSGELRICSSDGIGEFWLTPRICELQDLVPGHVVVLDSDYDQTRIHALEYDLRLGFQRPTRPGAIVTRLGSLHFMLYASERYIEKFGNPKTLDDSKVHRIVVQNAPGLLHDAQNMFIGEYLSRLTTTTSVNTSYSLYRAIANGVGIGALPTYISAISRQVKPLELPVRLKFDIWLSFDQSVKKSAPVRAAIDWLHECFDVTKYPWFSESFLHPSEFTKERAFWQMGASFAETTDAYQVDPES